MSTIIQVVYTKVGDPREDSRPLLYVVYTGTETESVGSGNSHRIFGRMVTQICFSPSSIPHSPPSLTYSTC